MEEIRGVGLVATKFLHLFGVPLIPLRTFFVFNADERHFHGKQIRFSIKSVLAGYGRALSPMLFFSGIYAFCRCWNLPLEVNAEQLGTYRTMLSLGVFAIPLMLVSYWPSGYRANYEVACLMADEYNFDEQTRVFVDFSFDRISTAAASRRFQNLPAPQEPLRLGVEYSNTDAVCI